MAGKLITALISLVLVAFSTAQSRDELLAVLDDIGRAIVDTAAPETDGVLNCTLSNDTDVVSFSDLAGGASGTFTSLRKHYAS